MRQYFLFYRTGVTIASFSESGKTPEERDKLTMAHSTGVNKAGNFLTIIHSGMGSRGEVLLLDLEIKLNTSEREKIFQKVEPLQNDNHGQEGAKLL